MVKMKKNHLERDQLDVPPRMMVGRLSDPCSDTPSSHKSREGDELAESAPPTKKAKIESDSATKELLGKYQSIREDPKGSSQGNKPQPPKR